MNQGITIITGGSSGIGAETARYCQEQGLTPIILDIQEPKTKDILYYSVDISKKEEITSVVKKIVSEFEYIHSLIHCAAVYPSVHLDNYSDDLFINCFYVNTFGPYFLNLACIPYMGYGQKMGYIVHVTSEAVYLGSRDPGYTASKSALAGLTKSLAKNLKSHNITVNSVSPGPIDTPMSQKGMRVSDVQDYNIRIPLGRFGTPYEVAKVIYFLISGNADYMTGTTLHVSGGLFMS